MMSCDLQGAAIHPALSPRSDVASGRNQSSVSGSPFPLLTPTPSPTANQIDADGQQDLHVRADKSAGDSFSNHRRDEVLESNGTLFAHNNTLETHDHSTTRPPVNDNTDFTSVDLHSRSSSFASTSSDSAADTASTLSLDGTAPLTTQQQKSVLLERRKHKRNTRSVHDIPLRTTIKALMSRPQATSNLSIASTMNSILSPRQREQDAADTLADLSLDSSGNARPITARRLSEAITGRELTAGCLSAKIASALASPCFFHKKFDDAINIDKVLEEIRDDEGMSHSRLVQTATGVREVSKQLQRRPIRMHIKNVMIVTKARDNQLVNLTRDLAQWLLTTPRYGSETGVNVYVDAKLRKSQRFGAESLVAQHPRFQTMLRYWTPDLCWTSPEKFDLVLTLGGDGTVLYTSWLFQRIVPPILSFSLGSLGFLTNFEYASYKASLDKIMGEAGMRVNLRMRFTCTVYRAQNSNGATATEDLQHIEAEQFEVLNELVIDRGPSPYVSQLELYGNDALLTVVQADGCIFSTPTGSTAYSLSAGGSLVHPDIPAILLTPICPHTLSFRPMLLNDSMLLRVAVPRGSRATAYCAFDGKGRIELRQGDHVTIAASQYPFPTVLSSETEWFDSISRTLRWNTRGAQQKAWTGETADGGKGEDEGFDIDFEEEDRDSGYSGEGSQATGGADTVGTTTGPGTGTGSPVVRNPSRQNSL